MTIEIKPDQSDISGSALERRHGYRRSHDKMNELDSQKLTAHMAEFDQMKGQVGYIRKLVQSNNTSIIEQAKDLQHTRQEVHEIKEVVLKDHETLLLRTSKFDQIPQLALKVDKLCGKMNVWSGGIAVIAALGAAFLVYAFDSYRAMDYSDAAEPIPQVEKVENVNY